MTNKTLKTWLMTGACACLVGSTRPAQAQSHGSDHLSHSHYGSVLYQLAAYPPLLPEGMVFPPDRAGSEVQTTGHKSRGQAKTCCPPSCSAPVSPAEPRPKVDPAQPPAVEPTFAPEQAAARSDYYAAAPNMIGDLFGSTLGISLFYGNAYNANRMDLSSFANLINVKVAENNSPLPMNRVAFRYNFFHNAGSVEGPSDLVTVGTGSSFFNSTVRNYDTHAFNFSVEKTFLNDRASVELRVPFFSTFGSEQDLSVIGVTPTGAVFPNATNPFGDIDGEFGDLQLVLKGLLYYGNRTALTTGLGVGIPSGRDSHIRIVDGPPVVAGTAFRAREFHVENDQWSLSPYIAALVQPNDRWFVQGFCQVYFPIGSNTLDYTDTLVPTSGGGSGFLSAQDELAGQSLLMMDVGVGYWVVRNNGGQGLTGLAPIVELHYTTALQDADIVTLPDDGLQGPLGPQPPPQVGNLSNRFDYLNMTVGATAEFGNRLLVTTGVALPLREGDDRFFDWELQVQVNYRFGPAPRYMSAPPVQ